MLIFNFPEIRKFRATIGIFRFVCFWVIFLFPKAASAASAAFYCPLLSWSRKLPLKSQIAAGVFGGGGPVRGAHF